MLNLIFDICEEYKSKEIFIWDVSRNSIMTFNKLAFADIKVSGFVCENEKFIGENIINLPIISLNDLKKYNDFMIVIPDLPLDYAEKIENSMIEEGYANHVIKHKNMYDISNKLKRQPIYVYGTGKASEKMVEISNNHNINIKGFIKTSAHEQENFYGKPVFSIDKIDDIDKIPILVAANNILAKEEILSNLYHKRCKDIFVDQIIDTPSSLMEPSFLRIFNAIKKNKKIFIYSDEGEYLNTLLSVFRKYNISIEGIVCKENDKLSNSISLYDLLYYNLEEVFIYINERVPLKMQEICKLINSIGITYKGYTGAIPSRSNYADYKIMPDILLGATILGNGKKGFYVYGDQKENDKKILILGGSTSTENAYMEKNWVRILYDEYLKGKNYTVYNGANCGFDIVQELLVLLRDGWAIGPDIVISMSGVNNLYSRKELLVGNYEFLSEWDYEKFDNDFNVLGIQQWLRQLAPKVEYNSGLENNENRFEFWYRNERILCEIAKLMNAKPFVFLQPMMIDLEKMDLFQYSMSTLEENKNADKDFMKGRMSQGIFDLSDLLDYEDDMYFDGCHYSENGARILAERVYSYIIN